MHSFHDFFLSASLAEWLKTLIYQNFLIRDIETILDVLWENPPIPRHYDTDIK